MLHALFFRNLSEFSQRHITVYESWINKNTPKTKGQTKQWTASGEPAPRKAKTVKLSGKVMERVFWDANEIIFIDYLEKRRTIIGLARQRNKEKTFM